MFTYQWYCPKEMDVHLSVVSSKGLTLVQWICHWKCPKDFQWHVPMEFNFCDFWCAIFCPESPSVGPDFQAPSPPHVVELFVLKLFIVDGLCYYVMCTCAVTACVVV